MTNMLSIRALLGRPNRLARRRAARQARVNRPPALMEPLEERTLLSLLGVSLDFPIIAYDNTGVLSYDPGTQALTISATPLAIKASLADPVRSIVAPRSMSLAVQVDNAGNLVGGVPGDDLTITGAYDSDGDTIVDVSGVLLTGEVLQFGSLDASLTLDQYDFRFIPTGGLLLPLFAGKDAGVTVTSENSTFAGSFAVAFGGGAKGQVGSVPALLGSLSGNVYHDANNDGVFDLGETGIAGASITLTGTALDGTPVNTTLPTAADGSYAFTGLRPGTYTITEAQPAGYLDGKDTQGTPGNGVVGNDEFAGIALAPGANGADNNFGEVVAGAIGDQVWVDANGNGLNDDPAVALPGLLITLTGTDDLGNAVNTTVGSSAAGLYAFTNLRPGIYFVSFSLPVGFTYTTPDAGGDGIDSDASVITGQTSAIVLASGAVDTTWDAGLVTTGGVDIEKYVKVTPDCDDHHGCGDGDQWGHGWKQDFGGNWCPTPTPGIGEDADAPPGVSASIGDTLTFTYIVRNTGNTPLENVVVTDDHGTPGDATDDFQPAPVTSGGFNVGDTNQDHRLDVGEEWKYRASGEVTDYGEQCNLSVVTAQPVGVAGSVTDSDPACWNVEAPTGSLSGYVLLVCPSGCWGGSDEGIAGVTVQLFDAADQLVATATTNASGYYKFTGLTAGQYRIVEVQPAGYLDGAERLGSLGGAKGNDYFVVDLGVGQKGTGYTFKELEYSSIAGSVFQDKDNDGCRDKSESGIEGVLIRLTGTDDLGNAVSLETTTDANGNYAFTTLRSGNYTVTEVQPAGYNDGKDKVGTAGGCLANDRISSIDLDACTDAVGYNFGERPQVVCSEGSISGLVFLDYDNDGRKDSCDSGIKSVKIILTGKEADGGTVYREVWTDSYGRYKFDGLEEGKYTIREVDPSGYADGKDTVGSSGGCASNDYFYNIWLDCGEDATGYNFAERRYC